MFGSNNHWNFNGNFTLSPVKSTKPHPKDKVFGELLEAATKAANEAGDLWMKEHTKPAFAVMAGNTVVGTMLDVCGFVYLEIKDKRSAFYKWGKEKQGWAHSHIGLNHKYSSRQEMGLKEACCYAAYKVLSDAGIKNLRVFSRID